MTRKDWGWTATQKKVTKNCHVLSNLSLILGYRTCSLNTVEPFVCCFMAGMNRIVWIWSAPLFIVIQVLRPTRAKRLRRKILPRKFGTGDRTVEAKNRWSIFERKISGSLAVETCFPCFSCFSPFWTLSNLCKVPWWQLVAFNENFYAKTMALIPTCGCFPSETKCCDQGLMWRDQLRLVEDVEGQESYHDLEVPDDSFAALLSRKFCFDCLVIDWDLEVVSKLQGLQKLNNGQLCWVELLRIDVFCGCVKKHWRLWSETCQLHPSSGKQVAPCGDIHDLDVEHPLYSIEFCILKMVMDSWHKALEHYEERMTSNWFSPELWFVWKHKHQTKSAVQLLVQ